MNIATMASGITGLALSVGDVITTGEAGVPAIVFTILSICTLIANTAIDIYKKVRAAKREEDKKDKEDDEDNDRGSEEEDTGRIE